MAYYNKSGYTSAQYNQAKRMIDALATERWRSSGENQPNYAKAERDVRKAMGIRSW